MELVLARLLDPRLEQRARTAEPMQTAARALEHWLAERALVRPRWHSLPWSMNLDYCRNQCCWMMKMMMTWGLKRTGLNCLRVWGETRVTKVMA
jgi:hypothetical protein